MHKTNKKYIHDIIQYTMIISLVNFIDYITATVQAKQHNLCTKLVKQNRKHYYETLKILDDIYSRYRLNKTTHSYADMIIKLIEMNV